MVGSGTKPIYFLFSVVFPNTALPTFYSYSTDYQLSVVALTVNRISSPVSLLLLRIKQDWSGEDLPYSKVPTNARIELLVSSTEMLGMDGPDNGRGVAIQGG